MIHLRFPVNIGVAWILALYALLGAGCNDAKHTYKYIKLTGYEQSNPSIVYLPSTISQLSGIVYYPKDKSIFCIDDNVGMLYKFPLYKRKILQHWPFSSKTDFEELVLKDSTFYALKSNGDVTGFSYQADTTLIDTFSTGSNIKVREFEAMVFDTARNQLLLVCKDCEDDPSNTTSVWGLDFTNKKLSDSPVFVIQGAQIEKLFGKKLTKFKPSAAAVHPLTGDFYYVSAINDILLVTDRNGVVKEATALDRVLFKQPEGLAFMPDGTLLVSNEYAETGTATILLYPYNKNKPVTKKATKKI
jgi:hypothetical protein